MTHDGAAIDHQITGVTVEAKVKSLEVANLTVDAVDGERRAQLEGDALGRLSEAASDPEAFTSSLQEVYGDRVTPERAEALRQRIQAGDTSFLPQNVYLADREDSEGPGRILGAYSPEEGGSILVAREAADDPGAGEAVYLEELGHHLDALFQLGDGDFEKALDGDPDALAQLNDRADAAGDEGARLSHWLRHGEVLPPDTDHDGRTRIAGFGEVELSERADQLASDARRQWPAAPTGLADTVREFADDRSGVRQTEHFEDAQGRDYVVWTDGNGSIDAYRYLPDDPRVYDNEGEADFWSTSNMGMLMYEEHQESNRDMAYLVEGLGYPPGEAQAYLRQIDRNTGRRMLWRFARVRGELFELPNPGANLGSNAYASSLTDDQRSQIRREVGEQFPEIARGDREDASRSDFRNGNNVRRRYEVD